MASVADIAPLETEFDVPTTGTPRKGRGPDRGPRAPSGFKKAVEEIANIIFSKTKISVEGAAKAVVPSIPKMLQDITDDIRTGSVDKFKLSLEKLEKLVDKLGLDLGKYNKDLAGFLKKREQNLIKSEEKIIRIREDGATAEINQLTGEIDFLSREEIKQRRETLRQTLITLEKTKKSKDREEKQLQKSRFLSEEDIKTKKEFVQASYEQIQQLEEQKTNMMNTLNIKNEEDLPSTGFFSRFRRGGNNNQQEGSGQGIRDFTPNFLLEFVDTFRDQVTMLAEPFVMLKDTALDLAKPFIALGKLMKPLLLGFARLVKAIAIQIATGMALVAVNLLRLLTDKKVLIGLAAMLALFGIKKGVDAVKNAGDGGAGSASDMAGEAAMTDDMDQHMDLKPGESTSIFSNKGPMFNKDGTESDLSKSLREQNNIDNRKNNINTLNKSSSDSTGGNVMMNNTSKSSMSQNTATTSNVIGADVNNSKNNWYNNISDY